MRKTLHSSIQKKKKKKKKKSLSKCLDINDKVICQNIAGNSLLDQETFGQKNLPSSSGNPWRKRSFCPTHFRGNENSFFFPFSLYRPSAKAFVYFSSLLVYFSSCQERFFVRVASDGRMRPDIFRDTDIYGTRRNLFYVRRQNHFLLQCHFHIL